jgi:hypothetical protein
VNDNIPLEEGLFLLAAWHYQNTFGYSYSDKPDECHPPHLLGTSQVRPLAKICSVKANDISAGNIERYIKATIIASVNRSVHPVVALEFMVFCFLLVKPRSPRGCKVRFSLKLPRGALSFFHR